MSVSVPTAIALCLGLVGLALLLTPLATLLRRHGLGLGGPDDLSVPALMVRDGRAVRLNEEAGTLLGLWRGDPVAPALRRLFGEGLADPEGLLAGAERDATQCALTCRSRLGRDYLLRIAPRGALIRLLLVDVSTPGGAGAVSGTEAAAEPAVGPAAEPAAGPAVGPAAGPAAADAATDADPAPASLARLPILLWQRDRDGSVLWASGRIGPPGARVEARRAAEAMLDHPLAHPLGPEHAEAAVRLEVPVDEGGSDGEGGPAPLALQAREIAEGERRLGFAVDAGEAVAAERTLARFVQTMTETFAHLTVGLAIFDRNHTLALFNPALVDLWKLDPAWLARRPGLREILDNLRAHRRIPEVRDYQEWRARLLGLLETPDTADYEELWTLADGTTIRALARPHPQGLIAFIFDDVTERLRLEQRNRHMDDLIRSTLDRLHEGLAVFAPSGTLQYVNRAFHNIWDLDETAVGLDMHVRAFCRLARRLSADTDVWERLTRFATGEANRRAWTARIALGSGRVLAVRVAPLPDGSSMAVFADVTDSERIAVALAERNEALESAERMRVAVLDQISHRLRTPLNAIFGFGEMLQGGEGRGLDAAGRAHLEAMMEAAAQLLDTIAEITELASLRLDPLEGEAADESVEDVLAMTHALVQRRADEARVALALDVGGPVGLANCNPVRLRQIVFNLVTDAIHRSGPGARVRLAAKRDADATVEIATEEIEPDAPDPDTPDPDTPDPDAPDRGAVSPGAAPAEPEGAPMPSPASPAEARSPTLALVRRMVAEEGGALGVARPGAGRLRVWCRFPEDAAPGPPEAMRQPQQTTLDGVEGGDG